MDDHRQNDTRQQAANRRAVCAAQLIRERADGAIDVPRLARELGISRRQLERDFRRRWGEGPVAFARRVRFENAARALVSGLPIVQVAMDHGYADQAHFTRVVRQRTGETPTALRRSAAARAEMATPQR